MTLGSRFYLTFRAESVSSYAWPAGTREWSKKPGVSRGDGHLAFYVLTARLFRRVPVYYCRSFGARFWELQHCAHFRCLVALSVQFGRRSNSNHRNNKFDLWFAGLFDVRMNRGEETFGIPNRRGKRKIEFKIEDILTSASVIGNVPERMISDKLNQRG